jgi:hypothetical protein
MRKGNRINRGTNQFAANVGMTLILSDLRRTLTRARFGRIAYSLPAGTQRSEILLSGVRQAQASWQPLEELHSQIALKEPNSATGRRPF